MKGSDQPHFNSTVFKFGTSGIIAIPNRYCESLHSKDNQSYNPGKQDPVIRKDLYSILLKSLLFIVSEQDEIFVPLKEYLPKLIERSLGQSKMPNKQQKKYLRFQLLMR